MSFICSGTPEYGWLKKVKELEPHAFRQWLNAVPSFRQYLANKDHHRSGDSPTDWTEFTQANLPDAYLSSGLLMDGDEVAAWTDAGIEVSVSRVKGLASNARQLADTIFQVSVANVGIMQVQCIDFLEDACTNEVQNWLDKGWRILAVCPPNDTRRPTYIMGHVDKEPNR